MYVKTHTAQLSRPVRTIMVRREGLLLSTRRYTMWHAVADTRAALRNLDAGALHGHHALYRDGVAVFPIDDHGRTVVNKWLSACAWEKENGS